MYVGRLEEALEHLDRVAALYDPAQHRHHAFVFGKDPFAITRVQAAIALFALGRPDTALAHIADGHRAPRALPAPVQRGLGAARRGDRPRAARRDRALARVRRGRRGAGDDRRLPAVGRAGPRLHRLGAGRAGRRTTTGLEEIRAGLEMWRMGGAQLLLPWLLAAVRRGVSACGPPGGGDRGGQRRPPAGRGQRRGLVRAGAAAGARAGRARGRRTARRRGRAHPRGRRAGRRARPSRPRAARRDRARRARRGRRPPPARRRVRSGKVSATADVAAANALLHERTTR